jgi:hypothetical protein
MRILLVWAENLKRRAQTLRRDPRLENLPKSTAGGSSIPWTMVKTGEAIVLSVSLRWNLGQ